MPAAADCSRKRRRDISDMSHPQECQVWNSCRIAVPRRHASAITAAAPASPGPRRKDGWTAGDKVSMPRGRWPTFRPRDHSQGKDAMAQPLKPVSRTAARDGSFLMAVRATRTLTTYAYDGQSEIM